MAGSSANVQFVSTDTNITEPFTQKMYTPPKQQVRCATLHSRLGVVHISCEGGVMLLVKRAIIFCCFVLLGCAEPYQRSVESDMIDRYKLAQILEKIGDPNDFSSPRPLVSLSEFFNGNNDLGSIWYNLNSPGNEAVYHLLKKIEEREEVSEILIQISQHDDPDAWLVSDTIWFITSASTDEIVAMIPAQYQPDDIFVKNKLGPPDTMQYDLPSGMKAIGAWYD